jgi:hypothetical protein
VASYFCESQNNRQMAGIKKTTKKYKDIIKNKKLQKNWQ